MTYSTECIPNFANRRILAAATIIPFLISIITATTRATPAITAERYREAIRFRTDFGLNTAPAYLALVEDNPILSRKYGVALTADEEADINIRSLIAQQLVALDAELAEDPSYSGMFIDQAAGGIVDIGTTGDPDLLEAIVAQFGPPGARYRIHRSPYSKTYLESLLGRVERTVSESESGDTPVSFVALDIAANRVKIGISAANRKVTDDMARTFGPAVEVVVDPGPAPASCPSQKDCVPPVKGGLELGFQDTGDGEGLCSSAFPARTTTGEVVLVTAGHCAGSHNRPVYNGQGPFTYRIGTIAYSTFYTQEPNIPAEVAADAGYLSLSPGMTGSNLVYLGPNQYGHIVDFKALSSSEVISGTPVCKMGASSGLTCGKTKSISQHYPDEGTTIQATVDATYTSKGGDSGAIVFMYASGSVDKLTVVGVNWEGGDQGSGYSPIDLVDSALNVVPCTSRCGATYHSITPKRVLDTRPASHVGDATTLHSNTKQTFRVSAAVPQNAVAVTGNLTVTGQSTAGYVTLAPSLGSGIPPISTINFPVGDNRANGVNVPLNYTGKLDVVYRGASSKATVNVIFDVTGYYTNDTSGYTYHTTGPTRVLDTRPSSHVGNATTLHSHTRQSFSAGVPSSAKAVTGNLTVTGQTGAGYVTLAPSLGSGVPTTSTINFPVGDNRANGVTVGLSASGTLDVMYWSSSTSDTVNVIFDVTGYFTDDLDGMTYHTLWPERVLDTRPASHIGNATTLQSQTKQTFTVVPYSLLAWAVTGNLTVTGQTALGFVTLAPYLNKYGVPATSTINFPVADNRANNVSLPLYVGLSLDAMYWSASAQDAVNIIFDLTGYYAY